MTSLSKKIGFNSWGMYFNPSKYNYDTFKKQWDYVMQVASNFTFDHVRIGYTYYSEGLNSDGSYNFERLDYAVQTAQAAGLEVIIPVWCVNDGLTDFDSSNYSTYLTNWTDMIQKLVEHFNGKSIIYEALDEALSFGHFWFEQSYSIEKFNDVLAMNKVFYNAVKQDPTAIYISGDFASNSDYVQNAISGGYITGKSFVSWHPYMETPETLLTNSAKLNFTQQLRGTGLGLIASEFGFGYPSAFNGANTREQQYNKLVRELIILDWLGYEKMSLFTLDSSDQAWAVQNTLGSSEILNETGVKLSSFMKKIDGYEIRERMQSSKDDYIFRYSKQGYTDKVVVWTTAENHSTGDYFLTTEPVIYDRSFPVYNIFDEVQLESIVIAGSTVSGKLCILTSDDFINFKLIRSFEDISALDASIVKINDVYFIIGTGFLFKTKDFYNIEKLNMPLSPNLMSTCSEISSPHFFKDLGGNTKIVYYAKDIAGKSGTYVADFSEAGEISNFFQPLNITAKNPSIIVHKGLYYFCGDGISNIYEGNSFNNFVSKTALPKILTDNYVRSYPRLFSDGNSTGLLRTVYIANSSIFFSSICFADDDFNFHEEQNTTMPLYVGKIGIL